MKNIEITAYQVGNTGKRDVNTSVTFGAAVTESSINKVAGTALNELFAWVDVQRLTKAKGLMFSMPIDLKFRVETESGEYATMFDTSRPLNENDVIAIKAVRQRLKLSNSAKSKRNFAMTFMGLFKYATRKIEERDVNELISYYDEADKLETAIKNAGNESDKIAAGLIACSN